MSSRATELRKGSVIEKDGDLLLITDYEHKTPGNLRAIIQMKTKSLKTGSAGSIRASSSDNFEVAYLDRRKAEYLYKEGNGDFIFMDGETFEQFPLPGDLASDAMGYVKENDTVEITFHDGSPIGVELPPSVVLEVIEAEQAVKGNTATNVKKEAVVETGLMVKVPMHVAVGDKIKIKTADAEFQGRVNE
jgi:elongation factor P